MLRVFCLSVVILLMTVAAEDDDDDAQCKKSVCNDKTIKKCFCRTNKSPFSNVTLHNSKQMPQLVMLTFDDAVNAVNFDFYTKELFTAARKNPNGERITGTFFVCHEYTNYAYINELYKNGHEIASHSITHSANTERWKKSSEQEYIDELDGMRKMLAKYGNIPEKEIKGVRVPFLQTAGDVTFGALRKAKFLYDSTMATRSLTDPPIWPYMLDHGFDQDCVIEPCPYPEDKFEGLWEVPLVSFWKNKVVISGEEAVPVPCAMADACTPLPERASDMEDYLTKNFERHYNSNRAPFPVFLHEAFLKDPERKKGYLAFIDKLVKNNDVYMVTVQDVIEFMNNPKTLAEYRNVKRRTRDAAKACLPQPNLCSYKDPGPDFFGERIMYSCNRCPKTYPWLNNIS